MRETVLTDGRPSLQVLAFIIVASVVIALWFCGLISQWTGRRRMLNEYYAEGERADRMRGMSVDELRQERRPYAQRIEGLARAAMGKSFDNERLFGLVGRAFTSAEEREWEYVNREYDELTAEIGRRDNGNA